jgi:hypothetical protein
MAITGLVKEEMIFRTMKHPGNEMLAWLPNVRVMFNAEPDRDAQFELAVRALIDGLHARLTLNRNTSTRTIAVKSAGNESHRAQQQQRGNTLARSRVGRKSGKRS